MIIQLQVENILVAHDRIILRSGGSPGVRDLGGIEICCRATTNELRGIDLYASIPEKASAMAFSLINNHPFVDGNKRIGYVAMRWFLRLNGYDITQGGIDEKEQIILAVAAGQMEREEFAAWVTNHMHPRATS